MTSSFANKLFLLRYSFCKTTLLAIENKKIVINLASHSGLFLIKTLNNFDLYNLKSKFLGFKNKIDFFCQIFKSILLKNLYYSWNKNRQYFKIKGLGFYAQYAQTSRHYLILSVGFSNMVTFLLPLTLIFIKNPKKKKNIFVVKNSYIQSLPIFINSLKKIKLPDCYKLKGLKILNKAFKIKQGKKKK